MNAFSQLENSRRSNRTGRSRLFATLLFALVLMLLAAGQARAGGNSPPRFFSPLDDSVVEGLVTIAVYAPDLAQYQAEFGVDNANWQAMVTSGEGLFQFKWNSAYAGRGLHTLTARFSLGPGRPPVAAVSISVWVNNEEPDAQAGAGSLLADNCINVLRPYSTNPPKCSAPIAARATDEIPPLPCPDDILHPYAVRWPECGRPAIA